MFGLISVFLFEKTRDFTRRIINLRNRDLRAMMVSFDEGTFAATNWTGDGCSLIGYGGGKNIGDRFTIHTVRTISGQSAKPAIRARVIARSEDGRELTLAFDALGEEGRSLAETAILRRARRQAAKVSARLKASRPMPKWMRLRPSSR